MLKKAFLAQVVQCGATSTVAETLWLEIETAYTEPDRFFHDLTHLEHMHRELLAVQTHCKDWETLLFSNVYHDVVYNVEQNTVMNDNEERSAAFAERHLRSIGVPTERIERCKQQILATQKHSATSDPDTNLLTDADLSILGQSWSQYAAYYKNIRKEFSAYPDAIYNAGRRKVLEYFLHMTPLFKTPHFHALYEKKAKENMRKELLNLQSQSSGTQLA